MAVALAAVEAMTAPDVTDVVGADMTVAADTVAVAMTLEDVVIASQAHTPSGPTDALTKKPLTAQNRALQAAMSLVTGSSLVIRSTTHRWVLLSVMLCSRSGPT